MLLDQHPRRTTFKHTWTALLIVMWILACCSTEKYRMRHDVLLLRLCMLLLAVTASGRTAVDHTDVFPLTKCMPSMFPLSTTRNVMCLSIHFVADAHVQFWLTDTNSFFETFETRPPPLFQFEVSRIATVLAIRAASTSDPHLQLLSRGGGSLCLYMHDLFFGLSQPFESNVYNDYLTFVEASMCMALETYEETTCLEIQLHVPFLVAQRHLPRLRLVCFARRATIEHRLSSTATVDMPEEEKDAWIRLLTRLMREGSVSRASLRRSALPIQPTENTKLFKTSAVFLPFLHRFFQTCYCSICTRATASLRRLLPRPPSQNLLIVGDVPSQSSNPDNDRFIRVFSRNKQSLLQEERVCLPLLDVSCAGFMHRIAGRHGDTQTRDSFYVLQYLDGRLVRKVDRQFLFQMIAERAAYLDLALPSSRTVDIETIVCAEVGACHY